MLIYFTKINNNYTSPPNLKSLLFIVISQVPFNFEAIQREHASRSHLPINLNLPPISTPPSVSIENRKNLETSKTSEDDSSSKSRRKPTVARVGGNLQILANFTQYCPPSHARTLFWNWTKAVSFLYLILIA